MQDLNYAKLKFKACKTSKVIEQKKAQYKHKKFYSGSVQSTPISTSQAFLEIFTIILS